MSAASKVLLENPILLKFDILEKSKGPAPIASAPVPSQNNFERPVENAHQPKIYSSLCCDLENLLLAAASNLGIFLSFLEAKCSTLVKGKDLILSRENVSF